MAFHLGAKQLNKINDESPSTTTSDTSASSNNCKNSVSVGQQTESHQKPAAENSFSNNISATSKTEPVVGTRMKAVFITAKANNSAPAVLSSATKLLVNDVLAGKTGPNGGATNAESSSSTKTWMDFSDLFSSSVESLSKLRDCTVLANQQQQQRGKAADDKTPSNISANVSSTGSEISTDFLKMFVINWLSSDSASTRYENTTSTEHSTQSIHSEFSPTSTDRLEYSSADKLELRLAIAKANNFSEFVRRYFQAGMCNNSNIDLAPTLPQIIKMAELLFKDYQQSILQISNA